MILEISQVIGKAAFIGLVQSEAIHLLYRLGSDGILFEIVVWL